MNDDDRIFEVQHLDEETLIPATGNPTKSHDTYDTFLCVSGGSGNGPQREVHLRMQSNDGEFAQGWFNVSDLRAALDRWEKP